MDQVTLWNRTARHFVGEGETTSDDANAAAKAALWRRR